MLIDSHCHFDDAVFDADRVALLKQASAQAVQGIVMLGVTAAGFQKLQDLSQQHQACYYTLGFHPMFIEDVDDTALARLSDFVAASIDDPKFLGIGEIGLDQFVRTDNIDQQIRIFKTQLQLAQQYQLPVILHVRKAIDLVIKYCREIRVTGGIAHAFNGSMQQAQQFIELGFKLGFGGAMTYTRARKIRALAENLDLKHIVLETDAPDMPPAWLDKTTPNSPLNLPKIALEMANLKGLPLNTVMQQTSLNCAQVLPKLGDLFTPLDVSH